MASPGLAAPSATTPPDPTIAVQYGILLQKAEAVPPAETVYNPGDVINVAYGLKRITRSTTRGLARLIRIPRMPRLAKCRRTSRTAPGRSRWH